MTENFINIDWIHVSLQITHDPKLISRGVVVHLNNDLDFNTATHYYKPQTIRSSFDDALWIKPTTDNSIEISGNFYKFLNHQNVTGTNNLIELVLLLVKHLATLEIGISPKAEELIGIQQGKFRLFRVDVNKPIYFESKSDALNYLENIKLNGSYPYRRKSTYDNTVYFGMRSRRWCLKFYHKGTEVQAHKNKEFQISQEILALADLMIRAEIRINAQQLKEWDLQFGYQWQVGQAENLLDRTLKKLILPQQEQKEAPLEMMKSKAEKKFYKTWLNDDITEYYSTKTVQRYQKRFLETYGINLNSKELKIQEI